MTAYDSKAKEAQVALGGGEGGTFTGYPSAPFSDDPPPAYPMGTAGPGPSAFTVPLMQGQGQTAVGNTLQPLDQYSELFVPPTITGNSPRSMLKIMDSEGKHSFTCEISRTTRITGYRRNTEGHSSATRTTTVRYNLLDTAGNVIATSKHEGKVMHVETGSGISLGLVNKACFSNTFTIETALGMDKYGIVCTEGGRCGLPCGVKQFQILDSHNEPSGLIHKTFSESDDRFWISITNKSLTLEAKAMIFLTAFLIYDSFFSETKFCGCHFSCGYGATAFSFCAICCCIFLVITGIAIGIIVWQVTKSMNEHEDFRKKHFGG